MLKDELETAKEAAQRAPSKTMKHLVERLRNQLVLKEKQQKVDLKCRDYKIIALKITPLWIQVLNLSKPVYNVCMCFFGNILHYAIDLLMMCSVISAVPESSTSAAEV